MQNFTPIRPFSLRAAVAQAFDNKGKTSENYRRPGLPMETLHVFTGDVPAKPTEGVVLTDDWCTPDAKGMSHCLNQVKFPDGHVVVFKHDHMMHMIPCIVPGDHAWFVKGAAAPMKMP